MTGFWQHSNLIRGEQVKIPQDLLIDSTEGWKRFIKATYEGETHAGILLRLHFKPSLFSSTISNWSYLRMINWSSLYAGHIHLKRISDNSDIRANWVPYERGIVK